MIIDQKGHFTYLIFPFKNPFCVGNSHFPDYVSCWPRNPLLMILWSIGMHNGLFRKFLRLFEIMGSKTVRISRIFCVSLEARGSNSTELRP